MKQMIFIGCILLCLLSSGKVCAIDQITVSPPNPREGDAITISFRTVFQSGGGCELIDFPVEWELIGAGAVRDLNVQGQDCEPFPVAPVIEITAINIGTLPPGNYEIHIHIVGPGSESDASRGSIAFGVGEAIVPITTLNSVGLALLILSVLGLAWIKRRGVSSLQ